jgi:hypothetical protein
MESSSQFYFKHVMGTLYHGGIKTTKNGRTQLPDTMAAADEIALLRSSPTSMTKTAASTICPSTVLLQKQYLFIRDWKNRKHEASAPPRHRRTGGCALHRRRPCSNRPDGHSCPKLGWATATLVPLGHHSHPHWASVPRGTGLQGPVFLGRLQ